MIPDVNDHHVAIEKKPTLGERLSHARQAKNLTIAHVATELRLTKQTIELIENEQWADLHGRAYARGYFSNYVKFLGLPEDEFLAAFNTEYIVDEPSLMSRKHQVEITHKKIVWFPSFLIIIIAVIGWFTYQQMQQNEQASEAAEVATIDEPSSLFPITEVSSNITDEPASLQNVTVMPETQQDINEVEQLVSPEPEALVDTEQAKQNTEGMTEQASDSVASQDTEQKMDDNVAASASGQASLDLRFTDDCWVQVKDADDKVLLKKLMTKNDSIVLTGTAPFNVMLGRASVSQVRFNDKLFDPSAFTQKDVARFTLGAES